MCGHRILFIVLPLFFCGLTISQNITESIAEDATDITNQTNSVPIDPDLLIKNKTCSTSKELTGICVQRKYCDYGTQAIDMTLYAPRGFITECPSFKGDIVCCPPDYLVLPPVNNSKENSDFNNFAFDDDDYD